jgi:cystathionine beta-synthase
MIEAAEKSGRLKPGGTIVEATAGNTGLGLALIAALKGYKVVLVVPDKMSREKVQHCKALGAEIISARSDVVKGDPEYYQDIAERVARERQAYYINQFANPANPETHELTTAPEIWAQMDHDIDAFVCGVGSGGTLTGIGRYLARVSPKTEIVLADPVGSILAPKVNEGRDITPGSWLIEGIGEDFVPDILDLSLTRKAYAISDEESLDTVRALVQREGILAGSSSGTLVAAALRYCREQTQKKRVVTLICDRGDKYLSKVFSDPWVRDQGFGGERGETRTLADILTRRHDRGETVFVRPGDTMMTAYKRMRLADVSQLPVIGEDDRVVGLLTEDVLLHSLMALPPDSTPGRMLVGEVMEKVFLSVPIGTPTAEAARILQTHGALVVTDRDAFAGLVTRIDIINHLVQQKSR